ncbi:NUDIX domain-containing protein [Dactylosporangium sp. NPDC051485]|uniref:NUDIX hydrolase n=1 Tax=Dactylosporangium sp. NPDC051485 TaxID=3154846 RepID=UPI003432B728
MIPEFVARLRQSIGPDELLWLPGVNAVVFDDAGRVLLQQKSADREWSILSGILDPGENPADGLCREIWEETGVVATVDRLVSITVSPVRAHRNGDRAQYLELTFRCTAVDGVARVNDDESDAVAWFAVDDLPTMESLAHKKIALAAGNDPVPWFEPSAWMPVLADDRAAHR